VDPSKSQTGRLRDRESNRNFSPGDRWRAAPYVDGWMDDDERGREREISIYLSIHISIHVHIYIYACVYIYKPREILRQRPLWVDLPVSFEISKCIEKTNGRTDGRTKGFLRAFYSFIHSSIHSFETGQRERERR
jgi:hypothetical protein